MDRSRLPEAIRNVPLDHLSSGALLRLDLDGDLVETPAAWSTRVHSIISAQPVVKSLIGLDPRVGSNIRLGDDPPFLPDAMRAQAEPHIARSPADADILLATFQEGRFASGGGSLDCGYSLSRDGGLSWTRALIPRLTTASGGPYSRATDPVAAVALNGDLYLNTLGSISGQFATAAVVVSRSTNGGSSFSAPVVVYQSQSNAIMPDKNWMAINTFPGTPAPGRVVVMFTYFTNSSVTGAAIARAFSDNGGVSWSPLAFIHPANSDTQGAQPVFLANGKLAVVYWNFNGTPDFADDFIQVVISDDGGTNFGAPKFVTNVNSYSEPSIRNGPFLPSATTDRVTGNIYVVYQGRSAGFPKIFFTKSSDNGDTWTTPIPISDNPNGSGVFNAAIAASDDGQTLTASFYDHRDNPASTTLIDLYLAQSFDGGATWQPNIRVSQTSTDAALAPLTADGYMLGDYLGIAGAKNPNVPAVPVWVDTRTGDPDPFVARVAIAPSFNFNSWQAAHLSLGQINNPALGGESGDADGDGEDNKSEFLSDTDPNDSASVFHTARQLNISARGQVGRVDDVLIVGFIISGPTSKRVIARAIGPSLGAYGVTGFLENPTLELVPPSGPRIVNDDWRESDEAAIQATGLQPKNDRESALVQTLAPGAYTAIVRGKNNSTGVALVELYDLDSGAASKLDNLSCRGLVGTNDNQLIGGVIVGAGGGTNGAGSAHVVVRGIGPSLAAYHLAGALQDPELLLYDGNGQLLATNDNWSDTQQSEIIATNLMPQDGRESAIVATLRNGSYTAIVRGKNRTTGVGLVESYNVP